MSHTALRNIASPVPVSSAAEYDYEHITKPPRKCFNVPMDEPNFIARVAQKFPNTGAALLVVCTNSSSTKLLKPLLGPTLTTLRV
eukprot:1745397-Pyramimonas_sp.AAC.2